MSLPRFKETGETGRDREHSPHANVAWVRNVYFLLDRGFAQIFGQIVSIKVMLHERKRDSISVQVGGCSRTKHNTRLFRTISIHLKSGIFVCRDRLLLLSRYLISFSRKYLLVLDRGISNEYQPGLSLRGGDRGFPPATMNVAPGYFHRKTQEK